MAKSGPLRGPDLAKKDQMGPLRGSHLVLNGPSGSWLMTLMVLIWIFQFLKSQFLLNRLFKEIVPPPPPLMVPPPPSKSAVSGPAPAPNLPNSVCFSHSSSSHRPKKPEIHAFSKRSFLCVTFSNSRSIGYDTSKNDRCLVLPKS